MRDNIMHHQMHTLDSPSVITFSTEKPRMLVSWSFIAQNAPTESCRCTTRIPWYHQNPAYTHRILFALTAWTSETIGVRNPCRLIQKSIPAARHGPLSRTSETNGAPYGRDPRPVNTLPSQVLYVLTERRHLGYSRYFTGRVNRLNPLRPSEAYPYMSVN